MTHVYATYPSLQGKGVFVTGGASGIGESLVEHFASQGARVHFVDIDAESGNRVAERLARPNAVTFAECDLTDTATLQRQIEAFAAGDGIDVLVNNAAIDDRHRADSVDPAQWRQGLAVNLDHQFFAAQAARKAMLSRGGGSIINLGSIMVGMGAAGAVTYVTAKGGIEAMTRALAREFGPDMIRVNCLVPGWVMTQKQIERYLDPKGERLILERQCLPEKVVPADVARMALFLAADDSRHCTSQSFVVDAGWV